MSLKRTAAAFETSETARSVQKRPDDADDVSAGRLEAKFANAVAGDTLAGNTVADNSGADYAVADDAVADDAVADDAVADDAVADDAVADEEAAQKILKSKVPEVAVRSPSGQEGCVKLKNGRPFKLQVGYHEIRQFVAGADANFPHRTFYLDVRGHQTDTSLPPAHACLWKGCNGSSTYHWSIDCPEVRRQMVGHRAHDLRLCWPAPPPPPPPLVAACAWNWPLQPEGPIFHLAGWCPQSAPRNRRPRTVRQLPLGGSTPSLPGQGPRTPLRVHLVAHASTSRPWLAGREANEAEAAHRAHTIAKYLCSDLRAMCACFFFALG